MTASCAIVRIIAIAVVLSTAASWASGQTADGGPDPSKVRMTLGPVMLNPTIAVTNVGLDDNVFNEATNPKDDFTATITPQADMWMRLGRTWLVGNVKEDLVWYQQYSSERSSNNSFSIGWKVPLNRLSVTTAANFLNTRDRPGYEIDARARRHETGLSGLAELRVASRIFVGASGAQRHTNFVDDTVFDGTNLRDELTRTSTMAGVSLRDQLTPLTSVSLSLNRSEDRFDYDPLRDSNSTSVLGTISLDPTALIKGSASFGYRDFQPLEPGLAPYQGFTTAVGLTYTGLASTTQVSFRVLRDVNYSYDPAQPYYVETGFNVAFAQQIYGPVDAVVRGGAGRLEYRDRVDVVAAFPNRTDTVRSLGGGVGYHLGQDVRIGLNVDKQFRHSPDPTRAFDGLTIGASITYGL